MGFWQENIIYSPGPMEELVPHFNKHFWFSLSQKRFISSHSKSNLKVIDDQDLLLLSFKLQNCLVFLDFKVYKCPPILHGRSLPIRQSFLLGRGLKLGIRENKFILDLRWLLKLKFLEVLLCDKLPLVFLFRP